MELLYGVTVNITEFLDTFERLFKADKSAKKVPITPEKRLSISCADSDYCCPICYVAGRMGLENRGTMGHSAGDSLGLGYGTQRVINAADCDGTSLDKAEREIKERMEAILGNKDNLGRLSSSSLSSVCCKRIQRDTIRNPDACAQPNC